MNYDTLEPNTLRDIFAIDANRVAREMLTPTIMRMRTEDGPDAHPLLALRLDRMSAYRDELAEISDGVNKGKAISGEVPASNDLIRRIDRALASCLRVLECADTTQIKDQVAEIAQQMSVLVNRLGNDMARDQHHLADFVKLKASALLNISASVNDIARQIEESYKETRIILAQRGARIEEDAEVMEESAAPGRAG